MSLGENLQYLRKRENLTQEQLAEKLSVSRQTISKWESDAGFPEMEKIFTLCDLFSCNMDELLRGDMTTNSKEEQNLYDSWMNRFSRRISLGVGILIAGFSFLVLLTAVDMMKGIGLAVFFLFLFLSVSIFVVSGIQHSSFQKKYPNIQMLYPKQEIERFEQKFPFYIVMGIGLILFGLLLCAVGETLPNFMANQVNFYGGIFLLLTAIGVSIFCYAGMQKSKYDVGKYNRIIQEKKEEEENPVIQKACSVLMILAIIIYLICGFIWKLWEYAWVVFPVAALLCGIVSIVFKKDSKTNKDSK